MFLVQKSRNFRRLSLKYGFFPDFFVINLQTLILDGGNQLNLTVFLEEHGNKFEKNFRDK